MNAYEQCLRQLTADDDRVIVMTAENRGHMRTLPPFLGDRFIDVGIAEQTMIGAAAGLALRGRVVITHALASFLTLRPLEFIRDDVAMAELPVIMVGMVPGVLSDGNGPTHQAIDDVMHMRGIPNVNVCCPADIHELVEALPVLVADERPWYVRYHATDGTSGNNAAFAIGKAHTVVETEQDDVDVTILTYGYMTQHAVTAAHGIEATGHSVRVVNMRTLQPYDADAILRAVSTSRCVVTLEDHLRTGGLYSIVAETLLAAYRPADVLPIDLGTTWFQAGRLDDVLLATGLDPTSIADRINHHLRHTT